MAHSCFSLASSNYNEVPLILSKEKEGKKSAQISKANVIKQ